MREEYGKTKVHEEGQEERERRKQFNFTFYFKMFKKRQQSPFKYLKPI